MMEVNRVLPGQQPTEGNQPTKDRNFPPVDEKSVVQFCERATPGNTVM